MGIIRLAELLGTEWRQLFVQLLLKSSPDLNPDAADELSDSQFVAFAALTPEQAVSRYLATEASRQTTTCVPTAGDLPGSTTD